MRRLKMTIGKYRIRKIDELNLVMEEKRVITEKKTNEEKEVWSFLGYFSKAEHALTALLNKEFMTTLDSETVNEVLQKINEVKLLIDNKK